MSSVHLRNVVLVRPGYGRNSRDHWDLVLLFRVTAVTCNVDGVRAPRASSAYSSTACWTGRGFARSDKLRLEIL